jgi:hypothetical protein
MDSIIPVLQELHPDSKYLIGQDLGIYWRIYDGYACSRHSTVV